MPAAECPSEIIDTRGNIGIIETRDTAHVFHPVPFRRVVCPGGIHSDINDTRYITDITETLGTIGVFHPAPFNIFDILDH